MRHLLPILLLALTALHGVPVHVCLCALPTGEGHCEASAGERPDEAEAGCCRASDAPEGARAAPAAELAEPHRCACPTVTVNAPIETPHAKAKVAAAQAAGDAPADLRRRIDRGRRALARGPSPPSRPPLFLLNTTFLL